MQLTMYIIVLVVVCLTCACRARRIQDISPERLHKRHSLKVLAAQLLALKSAGGTGPSARHSSAKGRDDEVTSALRLRGGEFVPEEDYLLAEWALSSKKDESDLEDVEKFVETKRREKALHAKHEQQWPEEDLLLAEWALSSRKPKSDLVNMEKRRKIESKDAEQQWPEEDLLLAEWALPSRKPKSDLVNTEKRRKTKSEDAEQQWPEEDLLLAEWALSSTRPESDVAETKRSPQTKRTSHKLGDPSKRKPLHESIRAEESRMRDAERFGFPWS